MVFRMIVCAEPTLHDLSVIVHEMGHLQYFMAFSNQPAVFQVKSISNVSGNNSLKTNTISISFYIQTHT